ncbi:MAG: hypothetical protein Fur0037_18920 [Planctomycetota bacterium]
MGDLRDQLRKARILSDKEARRIAHEQRVERKQKGREELERENEERERELLRLKEAERREAARRQKEMEEQRKLREELAAVRSILDHETRKPGPGSTRFYFQTADGHLPWLELGAREAQELRAGMLCVVRKGPAGTHVYRLIATDLARRVSRVMPEAIAYAPRGVL